MTKLAVVYWLACAAVSIACVIAVSKIDVQPTCTPMKIDHSLMLGPICR